MKIFESIVYEGRPYKLEYHDCDSFSHLQTKLCTQHYGICFHQDKIVLGLNGKKKVWTFPGGTIEEGETLTEALIREIKEETNMRILYHCPIGYQKVTDQQGTITFQLRSLCMVSPIAPFENDPDGDIIAIKEIIIEKFKDYLEWGKIGDRIIERAREIKVARNV